MNKSISITLLILIITLESVLAAPAQWGVAIKSDTKECAGYWAGDEYVAYKLPSGWKSYFSGNQDTIITEFGNCVFRKSPGDAPGEEEKCCREFGLTFVSDNIGRGSVSYPYFNFLGLGALFFIGIIALIIIIKNLFKKRSKK